MPHSPKAKHRLSRRHVLRLGGGLAAAGAVVGGAAAAFGSGGSADAAPGKGQRAKAAFAHPGMLHAADDLRRAEDGVAAGKEPWQAGWRRLTANPHSASTWTARPTAEVVRGGTGQNYRTLYNDIHAAYQNALRYRIGGTKEHGDAARDILNAWSSTLKRVTGNADRFLAGGIYGWQFANAAELMRDYEGFDLPRFQTMLTSVFQPLNEDFLTHHNGAHIENYWANWDLCNIASLMAIGILTDDRALFDRAVTYTKEGAGNGSIPHAVPFLHEGGLAQWQESGRDQGHTMMGMGQLGAVCEMAWSQGSDLYGFDDNRFLKAAQYVAKYNLGHSVPFTAYTWHQGQPPGKVMTQTVISDAARGQLRPVWEMLHHHYADRRGLKAPYLAEFALKNRAEGGGGDYGSDSGGFDQLGFGTLLYAK